MIFSCCIIIALLVLIFVLNFKSPKETQKKATKQNLSEESGMPNRSFAIMKTASDLATSTVIPVLSPSFKSSYKYLCASHDTMLDTVLFSCFILRAVCIMSSNNRQSAIAFSNEYVSSVVNMAKDFFQDSFNQRTVDSRFDFYDRIFAKKVGFEESMNTTLEEFEYIIKNDIIQKEFAPFSESSALPILGLDGDMLCRAEVICYYKSLLATVKDPLKKAVVAIQ